MTPEEEQLMHDINTILYFVDVENATQLSVFGLDHLTASLAPGSFSILFRNDHFSTLYKHPHSRQLFTLITDAGYASHAEVVWESLVDVNGSNTQFFSGDFRPVGHAPAAPPSKGHTATRKDASHTVGSNQQHHGSPSQEQTDADYAYALALQFQEEAQREEAQRENSRVSESRRRASNPQHSDVPLAAASRSVHNRSSSSISGGSRYPSAGRGLVQSRSQDNRPIIPARNYAAALNRLVDGADEAPPSYEQAANGPVYVPPPGSPHHELSSSHLTATTLYSGTSRTSRPSPERGVGRAQSQLGRRPPGATISNGPLERPRDKNKDCIVM